MTVQYAIDDILVVNLPYVNASLAYLKSSPQRRRTLYTLRTLANDTLTVLDYGLTARTLASYIRVVPTNVNSPLYKAGHGVTIFFDNDTQLNNSFEYSKAFLPDTSYARVLNDSGSALTKGQLVYQTGFDTAQQLPTVAVASAAAAGTSIVFGITLENIANGTIGSIVVEGSVAVDTSGFAAEGDTAYLSDTPGAISSTAGTNSVSVGKVICVGNPGSISIFSSVISGATADGGGGGGGGGGSKTFSNKTADFAIDGTADLIYTNYGAGATITGTIQSGLPVNTEFEALGAVAQDFIIVPTGGEQILIGNTFTTNGIRTASNFPTPTRLKKLASDTWAMMLTGWGVYSPITTLTADDLSGVIVGPGAISGASSWQMAFYTMTGTTAGDYRLYLGETDQSGMYADGSKDAGLFPVVALIINNDPMVLLESNPGSITFSGNTSPLGYVASFVNSQPITGFGGDPNGFRWVWFASDGKIYDGGQSNPSGPSIDFGVGIVL